MKNLCIILLMALVLCFAISCQDKETIAELEKARAQAKEIMAELVKLKAQAQVEEQNKELVARYIEAWGKGDYKVFKELLAPDYGFYSPSRSIKPLSIEETVEMVKMIFKGFPDVKWRIEELIAVGNRVIGRTISKGTHEVEYQGIPATGNKVEVSSISMFSIENGKIVEQMEEYDQLGLMTQLGMELKSKEEEK